MKSRAVTLASCVIAALAVFVVISALASAAMTLPSFSGTGAIKATSSSGSGTLKIAGGASILCENATGEFALESGSRKLGTFSVDFNTCTQGGQQCRSLGDALATILVTGSWHLVLDIQNGTDGHYILILLHELHIECPGAAIKLLLVLGDLMGSIAGQAGNEKEFGVTIKDGGGVAQEFSEFENDAGTGVDTGLDTSQEGGKQKTSFEESEENLLTFNNNTKIEN
jgi:hypothetical protein